MYRRFVNLFSIAVTLAVVSATASRAFAQEVVFPHVADGGGYKTVLLLTNATGTATTATISFFSKTGVPLTVTVGGNSSTFFQLPILALGSAKLTTSGTGSEVSTGWARVATSPAVDLNGNAVFQLFRGSDLMSEASVPAALPVSSADFYADEEGGFTTAVALANPGSTTAVGTLTLRNSGGETVGAYPISLPPGNQMSAFLFQLIAGASSGRAQIDLSSGYASFSALRFHTSSVFSTVSVGQPGYALSGIAPLFSPNGSVRARIISEIDKAQSSLDIAIYNFTTEEIRDALVAARYRGVAIRIIADSSRADDMFSEIGYLESHGFNLKRSSGAFSGNMYNKYMIIDGRVLLTGSYNWSANAEENSFGNAVFVQGSPVVRKFIEDFEKIWDR